MNKDKNESKVTHTYCRCRDCKNFLKNSLLPTTGMCKYHNIAGKYNPIMVDCEKFRK